MPAENSLPGYVEISDEMLSWTKDQIRASFDPEQHDQLEYDHLLSDDCYLKRFIQRKRGNREETIPFLMHMMEWKKQKGINSLTVHSFPKEFFKFGGIHVLGTDNDGNILCHVRLRLFFKCQEILDLLKLFTVFQMLRAAKEGADRGTGWVLLFDATGAGISNADLDMVQFVNHTLRHYFPSGQRYVLIHNMPWLLNALKNVAFTMIPAAVKDRIRSSSDKDVTDFIPIEQLPGYMKGTNPQVYPSVPVGVKTTDEMVDDGSFPLDSDQLLRVHKYYERISEDLKTSLKQKE